VIDNLTVHGHWRVRISLLPASSLPCTTDLPHPFLSRPLALTWFPTHSFDRKRSTLLLLLSLHWIFCQIRELRQLLEEKAALADALAQGQNQFRAGNKRAQNGRN